MDTQIIYALLGIITLVALIVFIFSSEKTTKVQTKEEKKRSIIKEYERELQDALSSLQDNKEARISKKNALLKKFSSELALNIFFDKDEIRDIILNLSKY